MNDSRKVSAKKTPTKSVVSIVSEMTVEQLKKLRTDFEEVDKSRKEAEEQSQKVQSIIY